MGCLGRGNSRDGTSRGGSSGRLWTPTGPTITNPGRTRRYTLRLPVLTSNGPEWADGTPAGSSLSRRHTTGAYLPVLTQNGPVWPDGTPAIGPTVHRRPRVRTRSFRTHEFEARLRSSSTDLFSILDSDGVRPGGSHVSVTGSPRSPASEAAAAVVSRLSGLPERLASNISRTWSSRSSITQSSFGSNITVEDSPAVTPERFPLRPSVFADNVGDLPVPEESQGVSLMDIPFVDRRRSVPDEDTDQPSSLVGPRRSPRFGTGGWADPTAPMQTDEADESKNTPD